MMMKRQKWGICLVAAATCAIGMAGEIAERFVYSSCDLCNPERMKRLGELTRTAASCGYTGMVLQGDIPYVFHMGEGPRRELRKYKRLCDELGIEIIPAVWSIGYGAMLHVDPNLAAGLPCCNIPYVASADGTKATYAPEPFDAGIDGGFEAPKETGNGRFSFAGWAFTEKPGLVSFVDESVKHTGGKSVRFELEAAKANDPKDPQARALARIKVKRNSRYVVSAWIRTEDVDKPSAFQIVFYTRPGKGEVAGSTRQLSFNRPKLQPSGEWARVTASLSTLDHEEIDMWIGSWGATKGRFWLDDVDVRLEGLADCLRRPGCPLMVRGEESGIAYKEGKDYAAVPPLGKEQRAAARENGSLVLKLLPGGRIRPGERLSVSGFRSHRMKSDSQVSVCMSEPRFYELVEKSAKTIAEELRPKKWFLPMDEIRAGGTCMACRRRQTDMAHIFGDCVTKLRETIRKVTPEATVYMWGDQLDPKMNAKDGRCMCRGTFAGSVDLVPKDIVIMHWGGRVPETFAFFREHGFALGRSIACFDGDWTDKKTETVTRELEAIRAEPTCRAVMFTTWSGDYRNLGKFAEALRK